MHANNHRPTDTSGSGVNESTKLTRPKPKRNNSSGLRNGKMDLKTTNNSTTTNGLTISTNHQHTSSLPRHKRRVKGSKHHAHHHYHQSKHSLLGMLRSPSLFPSRRLARWILRVLKVAAALNLFRAIPFFVLEIYYL
jgi:hypothetical protein